MSVLTQEQRAQYRAELAIARKKRLSHQARIDRCSRMIAEKEIEIRELQQKQLDSGWEAEVEAKRVSMLQNILQDDRKAQLAMEEIEDDEE